MAIFFQLGMLCLSGMFWFGSVCADTSKQNAYRNVWLPTYQGQRLAYCTVDGQCGLPVATRYCQMLGYEKAVEAIEAYNVGYTNYLLGRKQCKGWQCNGFKKIRCVLTLQHHPKDAYYRYQRFVFPRYNDYRVDWCYRNGHGCGHRAAQSFCRRLGYMHAKGFKKETFVQATKALGNQRLCFGPECVGFANITCYR